MVERKSASREKVMQIKILCVDIVHTTVRTFNVILSQAFRNFVLLISLLKDVLAGVRLSNVWREYEFPMSKCRECDSVSFACQNGSNSGQPHLIQCLPCSWHRRGELQCLVAKPYHIHTRDRDRMQSDSCLWHVGSKAD